MSIPKILIAVFLLSSLSIGAVAQQASDEGGAARQIDTDEVILVAGATGQTGSRVVQQLKGLGYKKILAMTRNEERAISKFGSDIQWVEANVTEPESLQKALKGVDRVISTIGSSREPGNGTEAVEYLGVKNLVDAAIDNDVKILVLTSSAGITDEDNELNRILDNVLIWKFKGEEYLRNSGLNYSIVRSGGLKPEIPGGQFGVYLGQGDDSRAGQISVDDVASVLIEAATNPDAHGKTYETFNYVTRYPAAWPATFSILQKD
jgi:uncharacterized protein YbjT (DUF2867 family)